MPARTLQRIAMSLPEWFSVLRPGPMDLDTRLARAKFRAWHRGTREADYLIGGFFDQNNADWDEKELSWFEELLEEQDVDIIAWALQAQPVPHHYAGRMMRSIQKLDYIKV